MSEEYISKGAVEISVGEKSSEYTKVVVIDKDGKEYSAGTDSGNTLTVNCPWATQDMANSLLPKFSGKKYQSYTARDAYISPDVELGGKVNVAGVSSAILKQNTEFGDLMPSTVSAPGEEELEHEFEYVTRVDREIQRQAKVFGRAIANAVQASKDGILEAHNELVAALTMADGAPEDLAAGISNYVRYDLKNNVGFAGTTLFAQIGDKAKAEINAYVIDDGKGHAKSFIDLLADVITLQGEVNLSGNLKMQDGHALLNGVSLWITSPGIISVGGGSKDKLSTIAYLTSSYAYASELKVGSNGFTVDNVKYGKKEITSTSGTVVVLGSA